MKPHRIMQVFVVPGALRVAIDGECFDKPMKPRLMRQLAIDLLQAAEVAERPPLLDEIPA